ncbi:hypothetical protein HN014_01415 [Aquimarina sp. TRL1]|uniref:hypothetical protein n=1 Tax=Aquimarina sp. (strain TRL1) TaxID=2736252 RepID=UPI00158EC379|nr:hypothetical protein [Aquimarina sp. TRL1]QKX03627.1 hypothetical protein HN014_01415 [Aquimarina sp. TRL1]
MIRKPNKSVYLLLVLVFSVNYLAAQLAGKEQCLFEQWELAYYKIGNEKYPPSKKEKKDYLNLGTDMKFISMSEEEIDRGTWLFNTNGSYIEMQNSKGEKLKAHIISITSKNLVLQFDIDELRAIEVHYSASVGEE